MPNNIVIKDIINNRINNSNNKRTYRNHSPLKKRYRVLISSLMVLIFVSFTGFNDALKAVSSKKSARITHTPGVKPISKKNGSNQDRAKTESISENQKTVNAQSTDMKTKNKERKNQKIRAQNKQGTSRKASRRSASGSKRQKGTR